MNLCSNAENGFVRIRNISSFIIYFEVDYNVGRTEYSDDSRVLRNGEAALIHIPGVASKIMINVYKANSDLRWNIAFQLKYRIPEDYCFNVSGEFNNPNIERVPCRG